MNPCLRNALFMAIGLYSSNVLAWGAIGHRTVALVAEQHMSPAALKSAHRLLDGQTLPSVAMWADEIRSDPGNYRHTFNWHYTTWQDDHERWHAGEESDNTGFLLTQLQKQLDLLKNRNTTRAERQQALRFVIHLMGDLHQPLHVGGGNDAGGNTCRVTWHGEPSNLHTVWDSYMLNETRLSYTELAAFVSLARTPEQTRLWQSGNFEQWSLESKTLRSRIYPAEVKQPLAPVTYLTYCGKDIAADAMPKLGYEYSYVHLPEAYQRLYQAGVRLAKVLNESL